MNSAWRRETVMSSRKMSLSGCRPARVTSDSSAYLIPVFGPRLTTNMPTPRGSSSRPTAVASSTPSLMSSTGRTDMVVSEDETASAEPHDEQKLTPIGFRCPQLWQNTSLTVVALFPSLLLGRCGEPTSVVGELPIGSGVQQPLDRRWVSGDDLADPALAIRI